MLEALDGETGAFTADTDGDRVIDTVSIDLTGSGQTNYTEHVDPNGTTTSYFDGNGDGQADIVTSGTGGNYDEIPMPDNPLLKTFDFNQPASENGTETGAGNIEQSATDSAPADGVKFSGTEIVAGSAVETKTAEELTIAADGTGYPSTSDFIEGTNGFTPL
ncbi:hypothetical protein ASF98_18810 [Arthrobacter sp. Leaf337]|nr:hypothetical protein ASF98_18810 [Arthrobacter sp. Leaf337]